MNNIPRTTTAAVMLAALAIAGCSSDSKSSSTTAAAAVTAATTAGSSAESAAAGAATMEIQGFAFSALTAKAGETITVSNGDGAKHTVTADDGSFDVPVDPGVSATFSVATAGTYEIHCEIHSSMKGSITIG